MLHRGFSSYLIDMHTDAAHWLLLHLHIYYTIAHTLLNKDTSGLCAAFSFYIALSARSYIPRLCLYGSSMVSQSKSQLNEQTYSHLETSDEFLDRLTRVRRLISFLFLIDKTLDLFTRFDFLLAWIK